MTTDCPSPRLNLSRSDRRHGDRGDASFLPYCVGFTFLNPVCVPVVPVFLDDLSLSLFVAIENADRSDSAGEKIATQSDLSRAIRFQDCRIIPNSKAIL